MINTILIQTNKKISEQIGTLNPLLLNFAGSLKKPVVSKPLTLEIQSITSKISPLYFPRQTPYRSKVNAEVFCQIISGNIHLHDHLTIQCAEFFIPSRIKKITMLRKNKNCLTARSAKAGDQVILEMDIPFRHIAHIKKLRR